VNLQVGQMLFASGPPKQAFLDSIQLILDSNEKIGSLARLTHDERFTKDAWTRVLHNELLQLFRWSLRRIILCNNISSMRELRENRCVLCLLPGYGIAVHVIRRALPFACLGINTVCSFPHNGKLSQDIIRCLASALSLSDLVTQAKICSEKQLTEHHKLKAPVIFTGRHDVFRMISTEYSHIPFIASTGRCSVVIGKSESSVRYFERALVSRQLPISCTRVGVSVVCRRIDEKENVEARWGLLDSSGCNTLESVLNVIHPSIVFLTPEIEIDRAPLFLAGYRVFPLNNDGIPVYGEGFGADPIGGWPGDYLI